MLITSLALKFCLPHNTHGCAPASDATRGKKNLMHAIRTLHYARQLLQHSKLIDLHEPNHYWPEVLQPSLDDAMIGWMDG